MTTTYWQSLIRVIAQCLCCVTGLASVFVSSALAQSSSNAAVPPTANNGGNGANPAMVVAAASVQAFYMTDLYAKVSGYVSHVVADIGDHVKAGQILAVIDDPELRQQYAKAQAEVAQANAALLMAKRQLDVLQAQLALEHVTLKRQEDLFAGKALTDQQIDEARAKAEVSSMSVEVGRAKITSAEADLRTAGAEERRLKALLGYTTIVAPFDGVVTRRAVNPGDLVQDAMTSRSEPLFTCQRLDVVRVFADIAETNAVAVQPGTAAEIRLYGVAGPVTVRGAVSRIAKALDPATRTMRVEIDVPNPDEHLLPGMYAQVTLDSGMKLVDQPKP
jgi:multidrug efflux pump subunit AcrA (membrane-fusion protein)